MMHDSVMLMSLFARKVSGIKFRHSMVLTSTATPSMLKFLILHLSTNKCVNVIGHQGHHLHITIVLDALEFRIGIHHTEQGVRPPNHEPCNSCYCMIFPVSSAMDAQTRSSNLLMSQVSFVKTGTISISSSSSAEASLALRFSSSLRSLASFIFRVKTYSRNLFLGQCSMYLYYGSC